MNSITASTPHTIFQTEYDCKKGCYRLEKLQFSYASYILLSLFNNHNNERSALGSLHLKPARYQQRLQTINYNSN
jgi:hypothetical protein